MDQASLNEFLRRLINNNNILKERKAKYAGNVPLDLINQIEDHARAIALTEQAIAGEISETEWNEALKPLLIGLENQFAYSKDKVVHNITNIVQQAVSAAEEAEKSRALAARRLAEGVRDYAHRLATIAGQDNNSEAGSPYKGLLAYRLSDAEFFFGRNQAIVALLETIRSGPLTILHAESGAGKSSLLQAGISHRLLGDGHLPVYVRAYDISPGLAIKRTFLPNLVDTPELANAPLREFLRQVTGVLDQKVTLYLLLDQFEEFFTLLDDATRTEFVAELAGCLEDESLKVRWVVALRSEFFGNVANFRPRIRYPFENDFRLNRLTRHEAETVVTSPAARQGLVIDPILVKTLLDDLRDEDNDTIHPPQIQLVCSALYNVLLERRANDPGLPPVITQTMYTEEGGAQGILRGHLNRVLQRTLNPQTREVAHQLLIALVSSDQRRIRRTRSDLANILAIYLTSAMSLDDLLGQLVESRLLKVEQDEETAEATYELAHDYLITEIEIDPDTQARKAAEELLKQEVETYRRHGTLLSGSKLKIIESQREYLTLDENALKLLRLSQASQRRAKLQWIGALVTVVVLIIGAALTIAIIQNNAAAQQRNLAGRAEAGEATANAEATRALQAEGVARTEATRALNAEATAQAEATKALNAQATARTEATKALNAQATAEVERNLALIRQLSAQALNLAQDQTDLALLLSLEANQRANSLNIGDNITTDVRGDLFEVLEANPKLTRYLSGHTNTVASVAFSPDGKILASGGKDGRIILWDAATGQALGPPLVGHSSLVRSLAFSPDGSILASGSDDRTIILWDVDNRQPLGQPLGGHTRAVYSVAFSPDGKILGSGSLDKTILLWDIQTHQPLTPPLIGHTAKVGSIAFSPDGRILASGDDDANIILWDTDSHQSLRDEPLTGHGSWVLSVAFSPDGKTLASGSGDSTIILWDVATGRPRGEPLSGHDAWVHSVAFSPDGKTLASGSQDSTIILWDLTSDPPHGERLTGHLAAVRDIAFSPDGTLASGGEDGNIILWDITRQHRLAEPLIGHTSGVRSVAIAPDGKVLASASRDNTIILWDVDTRQQLGLPLIGHTDWVNEVSFSPDGKILASGSVDGSVILWDAATHRPLDQILNLSDQVLSIAFSPNGQTLATGSKDNIIKFWDVATGQQQNSPVLTQSWVTSLAFSPNGTWLAAGGWDRTIRLWNLSTGEGNRLFHPNFTMDLVDQVVFSHDGQSLAAAVFPNLVILWNVADRQPLGSPLIGHKTTVTAVAFDPDDKIVASGGADKKVILWDIASGRQLVQLQGHTDGINSLTFSPDGRILATGSADHTVFLWDVSYESWQARACRIANRNLDEAEWKEYIGPDIPYRQTCPELPVYRLLDAAQELATVGDVAGAAAQFQKALTLDPGLDLIPEEEARRLAGLRLVKHGRQLAAGGEVEQALDQFHRALALDPNLKLNPEAEAWWPTSLSMIKIGKELVAAGQLEKGVEQFQNALELDPGFGRDSVAEAHKYAALELVEKGKRFSEQDRFLEALEAYQKAQSFDPNILMTAFSWNRLCWFGSLKGYAAEMIDACEQAVALAPNSSEIRDSRGLARALVGDYEDAIEDFEYYVVQTNDLLRKAEREAWIVELKEGRNPFDAETLKRLHNE